MVSTVVRAIPSQIGDEKLLTHDWTGAGASMSRPEWADLDSQQIMRGGMAALHIEDQVQERRSGHLLGEGIVSRHIQAAINIGQGQSTVYSIWQQKASLRYVLIHPWNCS